MKFSIPHMQVLKAVEQAAATCGLVETRQLWAIKALAQSHRLQH